MRKGHKLQKVEYKFIMFSAFLCEICVNHKNYSCDTLPYLKPACRQLGYTPACPADRPSG
jgi:hypothetical protein